MENWIMMSEDLENHIWNRFISDFNFTRNNIKHGWRSFDLPVPYIVYDMSEIYNADESFYKNLETKIGKAFIGSTTVGESIYVLDWQHPCYLFNPRSVNVRNEFGEWPIPLYPDGDYYFFLKADFSWGYLCHPGHNTVSIFGECFIKDIENDKPLLFNRVVEERR